VTREGLNRREALRTLATGIGVTASVAWINNLRQLAEAHSLQARQGLPAQTGAAPWTAEVLSPGQLATVAAAAELIIPTTETPGAKAALVDRYIDAVLAAADRPDRDRFLEGLAWLDAKSRAAVGRDFAAGTTADQISLLTPLSTGNPQGREDAIGVEFFTAIKALTIAGYYSTEIGLRQELGDDGRLMLAVFEGCTHPEHR
jgi:hypothetical protein